MSMKKNPVTLSGIEPATFRFVAATACPYRFTYKFYCFVHINTGEFMINKGAHFTASGHHADWILFCGAQCLVILSMQFAASHNSDPLQFWGASIFFPFPDDGSVSDLSVLKIKFKPATCNSQYSNRFYSTNFYSDASIFWEAKLQFCFVFYFHACTAFPSTRCCVIYLKMPSEYKQPVTGE